MLNLSDDLAPNSNEVAGEVIDGEAIIINLASGVYYSMDRVGGLMWALIEARQSLGEIATAIVAHYDVSLERAEADIRRVASELIEHGLVVVSDGKTAGRADREPVPERKLDYQTPELHVYRDMGDLLALDPPAPGLKDIPWKASAGDPP